MSLQPPRMTTLTQGFLDPKVRDWLYTIALAALPLLIGPKAMAEDDWELWLALVGSILVPGVARMNIDYSLGGRKPAGQHGKREAGREEPAAGAPFRLDPTRAEKVTPLLTSLMTNTDALTYVLGRLEKLDKGQQALGKIEGDVQTLTTVVGRLFDADPRSEVSAWGLPEHPPEEPDEPTASEDEPEVVYDAVRRAQELQVDRPVYDYLPGDCDPAQDAGQDATTPPEHRP